jgi:cellobiose-specific phosphotransferase system component IIC
MVVIIESVLSPICLPNQYENIVLIAGGIKKQEDYNALFALIDNHIPHVVLIGGYGVGGFGVVVIINILLFCDPLYAVFQAFKGFDGYHH